MGEFKVTDSSQKRAVNCKMHNKKSLAAVNASQARKKKDNPIKFAKDRKQTSKKNNEKNAAANNEKTKKLRWAKRLAYEAQEHPELDLSDAALRAAALVAVDNFGQMLRETQKPDPTRIVTVNVFGVSAGSYPPAPAAPPRSRARRAVSRSAGTRRPPS